MSIQFLKSSPTREDIGATLILAFAITSRIVHVKKGDSLVLFIVASSGIGLLLNFIWVLIPILVFKSMDKIKGFSNIGGYYYSWNSEHWNTYRSKLVSYIRYSISSIIMLWDNRSWTTPFIFEWFEDFENQLEWILKIITVFILFIFLWELNSFKRKIDLVRVTNALENWIESDKLHSLMRQNRWEDVYIKLDRFKQININNFVDTARVIDIVKEFKTNLINQNFGPAEINALQGNLKNLTTWFNNFMNTKHGIPLVDPNLGKGYDKRKTMFELKDEIIKYSKEDFTKKTYRLDMVRKLNEFIDKINDLKKWVEGLYPSNNLISLKLIIFNFKRVLNL